MNMAKPKKEKQKRNLSEKQKKHNTFMSKCMADAPKGKGTSSERKEQFKDCNKDWKGRNPKSPLY